MRLLSNMELAKVAGGDGEYGGDIVVTGIPFHDQDPFTFSPFNTFGFDNTNGGYAGGAPGAGTADHLSFDVGKHHIDLSHIHRPLTDAEMKSLEHWAHSLQKDDKAVAALNDNDNMYIIVNNVAKVTTGAEVKELWSKANFVLNDNLNPDGSIHKYANGTDRGESDLNGGSPVISFNMHTITDYDNDPTGLDWLALHELGHLTTTGQAVNGTPLQERVANDIARAIEQYSGIAVYNETHNGYSDYDPQFWHLTPPRDLNDH